MTTFSKVQGGAAPQVTEKPSGEQKPKETSAQEFQNTIFEQYQGKITAAKAQEIFTNNDANHSNGLDGAEMTKAMADVSAYVTSAINNAASGAQSGTDELGAQARQGAVEFNQMTPEQQAADIVTDLKALTAKGADISVQNGQIMYDGQPVDLKSMGASDEAVELIKTEIEKFAAEQASKKQDE